MSYPPHNHPSPDGQPPHHYPPPPGGQPPYNYPPPGGQPPHHYPPNVSYQYKYRRRPPIYFISIGMAATMIIGLIVGIMAVKPG